jgi:hypothetical protein
MIKFSRINDVEEEDQPWLINGFICPWLTLLSGQPKHGKSVLAGHIATALTQGGFVLDRPAAEGNHLIGWMGYDAGWKQELRSRWTDKAENKILTYEPIRNLNGEEWLELAKSLSEQGVTLFILDHLYGMAGALGLNDAEQFAVIGNLLRPIYEDFGIAVLLLAQAGKSEFSRGRAAHSVAIEGQARALIRIYEKRQKGSRKIELSSNTRGEEVLSVTLTDEVLEFRTSNQKKETSVRESPDQVRSFLHSANPSALKNWSAVGRELARLQLSINAGAGRQMARRWKAQGLLKTDADGSICAGDSLLEFDNFADEQLNRNASRD